MEEAGQASRSQEPRPNRSCVGGDGPALHDNSDPGVGCRWKRVGYVEVIAVTVLDRPGAATIQRGAASGDHKMVQKRRVFAIIP